MKDFLQIILVVLYFMVGLIGFVMACKSIFARKYLSFHEKAAGKSWDEIEKPLQSVIVSLLRLGGLGFLTVSILLIIYPIADHFIPNVFYRYAIPATAFIFCSGLFANNYILHKRTRADTPWKGALYAMIILGVGLVVQSLAQ